MNRRSREIASAASAVHSSRRNESDNEHKLPYSWAHNKSLTTVDASHPSASPANQTNRQYLGGIYDISTYFTEPLSAAPGHNRPIQWELTPLLATTQTPIDRIFVPSTQYLRPNGLFAMAEPSANLLFEPIDTETYQLNRPPSHTNVPQFDGSAAADTLHRTHNVTRPQSIGTDTRRPDLYDDFHATQAQPTVTTGQMPVVYVTTTVRSIERNPTNQSHSQLTGMDGQYNGSLASDSEHLMHSSTNSTRANVKGATDQECSVTPNTEQICGSTDLKIVIKLDTGSSPIAATANDGKVQVKQKVRRIRTTTIVPYVAYEPYNYADGNDEEDDEDEDYGFDSYVEPIQSALSFMPAYETRKKKHGHKPMHMKKPHKHHDDDDVVHKYQTIFLQTHSPPMRVTEPPSLPPKKHIKEFSLHGLFYKLLAFMPFLALKPIFFGFWTMVLSPFVVIAVSGVALAVTLYPWISISQEQVAYARLARQRAPQIIVHRHPAPRPSRGRKVAGPRVRLQRTKPVGWHERKPPFYRRHMRTSQPPFDRMREPSNNGSRRSKRFPLALRANLMRHRPMKRRARDTHFQEWLLVQNNFNVRILSPHKDRDHYY